MGVSEIEGDAVLVSATEVKDRLFAVGCKKNNSVKNYSVSLVGFEPPSVVSEDSFLQCRYH